VVQADRLLGGPDAYLVIDDTALPKKGSHSVGVTPQYTATLGKNANCQTLVSLTLARDEVPVPVTLRLFLPETWTADPARLERASVPEERRGFRTKPEMALAEIDRLSEAGLRFGCIPGRCWRWPECPVLPGPERPWSGLGCRHPAPSEGLPGRCDADLPRRWPWSPPPAARARPVLPGGRDGAGRRLLAPCQLAPGHQGQAVGPLYHAAGTGSQMVHLSASAPWAPSTCRARVEGTAVDGLVGEHRASAERKYHLANLPSETSLRRLAAAIKAPWTCEQAHQQIK
jgi:hypothetical protein